MIIIHRDLRFSEHVPKIQAFVAPPGHRCCPRGIERHHHPVHVCKGSRVIHMLLDIVMRRFDVKNEENILFFLNLRRALRSSSSGALLHSAIIPDSSLFCRYLNDHHPSRFKIQWTRSQNSGLCCAPRTPVLPSWDRTPPSPRTCLQGFSGNSHAAWHSHFLETVSALHIGACPSWVGTRLPGIFPLLIYGPSLRHLWSPRSVTILLSLAL